MTARKARCLLVLLTVVVGATNAQTDGTPGETEVQAERARLEASKHRVERRYQEAVESCQQRFAVSACANDARSERRSALADLRRQEQALNTEERKRKASEAASRIERRLATPAVPSPAGAPRAPSSRPRLSEPRPAVVQPEAHSPSSQAASGPAPQRERQRELATSARREASTREAHARAEAAREAQAKALRKREAHEQRMSQRRGERAAPLPDPAPGASAAGQGHRP